MSGYQIRHTPDRSSESVLHLSALSLRVIFASSTGLVRICSKARSGD